MKFADKIKSYRHQYNLTQQAVADQLMISRKTISSWENGRSYPDIFMLVQISDLYHVSLDDLLREDHEMINNYKEEHALNTKKDHAFSTSYLINVVTCIYFLFQTVGLMSVASLSSTWRLILGVIVGIGFLNACYLLSKCNWKRFSGSEKVGILITIIVITVLLMKLNDYRFDISNSYNNGRDFGIGFATSIKSIAFVELIWLYPQFKKVRKE
ncbi:helix-turn-helix transcriptional regulator [Limosilactobacillus sp. STM2_1]|uniref:Helix-turn-helix transcriptional regulator n=1 Tax=Limosilactobacillus rudii TaxID=2759755 RepID=A0A7W3ULS3_9LACO|nr:helix-turn-helix transcriptional regulator [Limosilactobacillus rudii]MBB1079344.1 helix-turn-helix transcriptional regulator [Limosilactobacillus rudii]MBB1097390.1 helix-turn-helix transcriptional regulator [Limosilactobacillus rudii]MCD7134499.1 helix-turn-helix domain-containing protein [Limosilactobacillus rudii]